jgi:hypothetical protein
MLSTLMHVELIFMNIEESREIFVAGCFKQTY